MSLARGLRLVGEHVAAELDLQRGRSSRPCAIAAHVRREIDRHVVRLHVEQDLGVRDLAVLREMKRGCRPARTAIVTETTCGCLRSSREDRLDRVAARRATSTSPSPSTLNTRSPVSPLRSKSRLQHVERALRLGARQRERLQQVAADGLPEHADADERDDPADDHDAPPAVAPVSNSTQHV